MSNESFVFFGRFVLQLGKDMKKERVKCYF